MDERSLKWHTRFMDLATEIGSWSKDPSMKVGSVIVDADRTILGTGYNGFPRGVDDSEDWLNHRPTKYMTVIHAELNAILSSHVVLKHHAPTLYCSTGVPCPDCMKHIIQAGVVRVVFPPQFIRNGSTPTNSAVDWDERAQHSRIMAAQSGVELVLLDGYPTRG